TFIRMHNISTTCYLLQNTDIQMLNILTTESKSVNANCDYILLIMNCTVTHPTYFQSYIQSKFTVAFINYPGNSGILDIETQLGKKDGAMVHGIIVLRERTRATPLPFCHDPGKKRTEEQSVNLRVRGPRSNQSPSEDKPQPLPETQKQPITLRGRGPRSSQSSSEEEGQGQQSSPEEEDPGAPRHHRNTPSEQETYPVPLPKQKWEDLNAKVHTT
ncbi:hypothetical protein STEG23_020488, partial [Scotinomys teguina]